jgi:hypothetical protein
MTEQTAYELKALLDARLEELVAVQRRQAKALESIGGSLNKISHQDLWAIKDAVVVGLGGVEMKL